MSDIIACPSGLTGRIRGMKVREERVVADRTLAKSGGQVDELLAACCEETLDPAPYLVPVGTKLDWGKCVEPPSRRRGRGRGRARPAAEPGPETAPGSRELTGPSARTIPGGELDGPLEL